MMLRYIVTKTAQYCSETISQIYYNKPTKFWGKNFVHLNVYNYNSHVIMNSWDYTSINTVLTPRGTKKKFQFLRKKGFTKNRQIICALYFTN